MKRHAEFDTDFEKFIPRDVPSQREIEGRIMGRIAQGDDNLWRVFEANQEAAQAAAEYKATRSRFRLIADAQGDLKTVGAKDAWVDEQEEVQEAHLAHLLAEAMAKTVKAKQDWIQQVMTAEQSLNKNHRYLVNGRD